MIRKRATTWAGHASHGDFHYNGHKCSDGPEMAGYRGYRINPGNVGTKYPTRTSRPSSGPPSSTTSGADRVNWGSLDQQLLTDLMEGEREGRGASRVPGRDDRRDDRVGDALRRAAEETASGTTGSPVGQGVRRADLVDTYRRSRAVGLSAPSRPDGGRHGHEGDRRLHGRSRAPAQRGDRGHDPRLAHPGARSRPRARGGGRAAGPAVDGLPSFLPQVSACPAAGARPRRSSRRWPATSPSTSRCACPSGATRTPAWRS